MADAQQRFSLIGEKSLVDLRKLIGVPIEDSLEPWCYEASRDNQPQAIDRYVSNSYHETMGVPLREGRYFNAFDRSGSLNVALVNEQFAKRYFPRVSPVGRRLRYPGNNNPYTIIGVTAGECAGGMDEEPKPMVYFSMNQAPWTFFHLIVKSGMDLDTTVR